MSQKKKSSKSKVCPLCKKRKSKQLFYFCKSKGISGYCIKCDNKKSAERRLIYREENKIYLRNYYKNNKEKHKINTQMYYYKNRKKINEYKNNWQKTKYKTNYLYRLKMLMRSRFKTALKHKKLKKTLSILQYLGCNIKELKVYIKSKFKPGMNWKNHGKWHIDHIIPLSSAKTEQDLVKLFHYTNIQPLWAHENLSKGAKNGET